MPTPYADHSRRDASRARPVREATPSRSYVDLFGAGLCGVGPRGGARHVAPGGVISIAGDRCDTLYRIESGVVRCCAINSDGRRQIFRFARAGEALGLPMFERWRSTAEAVDDVILRPAPRSTVEAAVAADPALQREMRDEVGRELEQRERQVMMLAYMAAHERLLCFLKSFEASSAGLGWTVLPMTRQDIGDYLGLSLETVSRAFGALKRSGAIVMNGADRYRVIDGAPCLYAA